MTYAEFCDVTRDCLFNPIQTPEEVLVLNRMGRLQASISLNDSGTYSIRSYSGAQVPADMLIAIKRFSETSWIDRQVPNPGDD